MSEYLTPGVYIEEPATGAVPIEGVSTSTVGMVGRAPRGPTRPTLVTSWIEYTRLYGGLTDPDKLGYLSWGAQGFFANGGKRAYIARVAGPGAKSAKLDLGGPSDDKSWITINAIGPGAWGNRIYVKVGAGSQAEKGKPTETLFSLQLFYFEGSAPTPFVDPTDPTNRNNPDYREPAAHEVYDNLSPDPLSPAFAPTMVNAASSLVQLEHNWTGKAANKPAPAAMGEIPATALGTAAGKRFATGDDKTLLVVSAASAGKTGNALAVEIAAGKDPAKTFTLTVTIPGATDQDKPTSEIHEDLTPGSAAAVVNAASRTVRLSWKLKDGDGDIDTVKLKDGVRVPAMPAAAKSPLAGGADPVTLATGTDNVNSDTPPKLVPLTAFDYAGESDPVDAAPEDRTGLAGLATIRDIALLAVPDQDETALPGITSKVVGQCDLQKDRFCVLQFPNGTAFNALMPPMDSAFGAVYHPWINVLKPDGKSFIAVPPAGHIAGVIARTDIERGVHKAPANEVLRGVLTQDVGASGPLVTKVTTGQQDVLNPKGVNCVRDFRSMGRDIRIWGARTMTSDAQWKYVSVRRLFIMIEQSIERGTHWVVFEPNDAYTWNRVVSSVSGFLTTLWRNGALFGTSAQEAFFVKCDQTTMTQDDIDNGRLVCLVGVAPVKPAEFVIFRFSQKTAAAAG